MQTVIENAQGKCKEAKDLLETLTVTSDKHLLKFAIDNVYMTIKNNDIPRLIERIKSLNHVYINMKYRR